MHGVNADYQKSITKMYHFYLNITKVVHLL